MANLESNIKPGSVEDTRLAESAAGQPGLADLAAPLGSELREVSGWPVVSSAGLTHEAAVGSSRELGRGKLVVIDPALASDPVVLSALPQILPLAERYLAGASEGQDGSTTRPLVFSAA